MSRLGSVVAKGRLELGLKVDFGDWAGRVGGKLGGEDYCFEIAASKLLNNSTTSPTSPLPK